jgi:hypothetical protein
MEHARHFARTVDAHAWLDTVTTAAQTGTYVDPAKAKIAMSEWTRRWLAGQRHLKPSTRERYAGIIRTHIDPQWADVSVADVSHADVQLWIKRARPRSGQPPPRGRRVECCPSSCPWPCVTAGWPATQPRRSARPARSDAQAQVGHHDA